jgi:hypothetical protein
MTYDPRRPRRTDLIRRAPRDSPLRIDPRRPGELPAVVAATRMADVSFPSGMSSGAAHLPRCTFGGPFTRACSLPVAAAFERSHREG